MKIIQKSNNNKKPLIIAIAVIVALLLISFVYFYVAKASIFGWSPIHTQKSADSSGTNPPTNEQIKNGQDIKKQSVENEGSTSGSDQPPSPTPTTNGKSMIDIAFTAANQTSSTLQLRTLIYGIDSTGTCTLTLTKTGSTTITKTASTQNQSNTSTCTGFDIPLTDMSTGEWQASLSYSSNTLQGSTSKSIMVN